MSVFKNSSRKGETFVPMPTQQIPGIPPIAVQAIENLFPGMDDQKYVFQYVLKLGERWKTYRQPKWLLALLCYSKGKKENLLDLDSPLLTDGRFMVDEFEPVFPNMREAEEWVQLITNWRSGGLPGGTQNDSVWILQDARRTINQHFGFMLARGYEIYSANDYPEANKPTWEVILRKQDLLVRIYAERRRVEEVSFRTSAQPADEFGGIASVVYALSGGKIVPNFFGGTKGFADLLQKHLNLIEAGFGNYVKNGASMQVAQKEYLKAISHETEYQQTISPIEAKIIPVLHYPLMAIILILLVGAFTTLYMVLLNQLFSASSTSGILGIVSLLLAIGTVVMLRRLIK